MKTLKEIINGYQSTFEHMSIMAVASRLEAATCCGNEAEAAYSEEFYDCVQCILYDYVVSGSFTAAEIPCDVSILDWVNAQHYVINWFNDYNVPYDDNDLDDDCTEDVVDTEITEDMMYPDGSSYFTTKDMEAEYDCIEDVVDNETTEDAVDNEITEDMMYPDCSSHFIIKDMEAEYDVSCKDCPDDECTGHCMSCCYR